jgi:hypothetical protein
MTRRRVANSPDVKGVFGNGASVVAVAPPPPDASGADVSKLFSGEGRDPRAAALPTSPQNDNARAFPKNRGLWSEPREGSGPVKQTGSYSGPLPSAVTGTLSEPPIRASLSAAPAPAPSAPPLELLAETPIPDESTDEPDTIAPAARSLKPEPRPSQPMAAQDAAPVASQRPEELAAPVASLRPRPRPSARRIPASTPAPTRRITPLPLILLAVGGVITGLALFFMGGSARLWPLPPSAAKTPAPVAPLIAEPPAPPRLFAPALPEPAAAEPPPTAAEEAAPAEAASDGVTVPAADAVPGREAIDVADPSLLALARSKFRAGDLRGAESILRLALARAPDDHHAAEALVQALLAQHRGAEAVPYAEQIVRKRPRRAAYRFLEGDAKQLAGDVAGAIAAWRAALELEPDNAVIKRRLAEHSASETP